MDATRKTTTRMYIPKDSGEVESFLGVEHIWKITSEMSRGAYAVFVQVLPVGEGIPMHIHHLDEESILLLDGELLFQLGDERFTVHAGDMVNMPRGLPHGFRCTSATPARVQFTIDLTPGADYERMFRRLTELAPDDLEGNVRVAAENNVEFLLPLALPELR